MVDPDETHEPVSYAGPGLVLCEGRSDAHFLSALLDRHKIEQLEATFPSRKSGGGDGVSAYEGCLKAIRGASSFRRIRVLIVMCDCTGDPEKALNEARRAVESAGLVAPDKRGRLTAETPRVGIWTVPDTAGTLEHLLLDACVKANPEWGVCVDAYAACLGEPVEWSANKRAKMKLHALIAGTCKDDPATSLSYLWGKKGNPIPIQSERFQSLVEFCRQATGTGS